MRAWIFPVTLEPRSPTPLFAQIARAISDDVRRGRLRPEQSLPGTRSLARTLAVHRSTVVAAYDELAAQGWVRTRPGASTVVAVSSPEPRPRRFGVAAATAPAARPGFDVAPGPEVDGPLPPPGVLALWGGVPDLRLAPQAALGRAWRRAVRSRDLLGYAANGRGDLRLRRVLAALLCQARGLAAGPDDLMVVRGSQMALDLTARALIQPGDVVVVEAPGYGPARRAFARAGGQVVPVAVDREGLDVAAVEALARRTRVRLVYVTPHHQYPTTVTLSASRRLAFLDLAARHRIAVLEDDYDHEFHYDGRPLLPLASGDRGGVVIYAGSLAKVLAPGLRLGFVVAPRPLLDRLAAERALVDRQGDLVLERAAAELLEEGELQRHVRRLRRVYQARRDALCAAIDHHLPQVLSYRRPAGGMALWAGLTRGRGADVEAWQARALAEGLMFQTGRIFSFDGRPTPHLRLGFAIADEGELERAAAILARTVPPRSSSPRRGRPRRAISLAERRGART
ncbi:MAG TPA: PLP-dependent aminotransferase family protein [Polyangia bacterium]|nr:PLP-dependent aminotransferase family protein [Polyangia bacterium]